MPKKFLLYTLIFIVAATIGSYLRLFPLRNYVSSSSYDRASILIMRNAANIIKNNIQESAGSLSANEKDLLTTSSLNRALETNKKKVRQNILHLAKQIDKEYPPQQPYPYLLASDSFYYYDLTRTIQKTGRISSRIKGNKYFNPKMAAPTGEWVLTTWQPYIGYMIYSGLKIFSPDIPLMYAVSFTPLLIMALTLLCFFIITHKMDISLWALLISSIYLVCVPVFLKRSAFGWFDNDPHNVLFPMIMLMIVALAQPPINDQGNIVPDRPSWLKAVLAGAALSAGSILYSFFWPGWPLIAAIISFSLIMIAVYQHYRHSPNNNQTAITLTTFLVGSLLGIGLLAGPNNIITLWQDGLRELMGFLNQQLPLWPDTFVAVGELKRPSLIEIIRSAGGFLFFTVAIFALINGILALWKNKNALNHLWCGACLFLLFSLMISLGAQRFTILCIAPLTVLFALGLNTLFEMLKHFLRRMTDKKFRMLFPAVMIMITIALIIPKVIASEKKMPELLSPLYNDAWNESMTFINHNTPDNAIINSWWPPGHFIKAMADRRVTFDGATINNRQSYWLAKAFMAKTEKAALNYLRLLNNSGNKALDLLLDTGMSIAESVALLDGLIHDPKPDAYARAKIMIGPTADALIALTHGQPDPSYLFIYNEMIENFVLYPFITRWDFDKVQQLNDDRQLLKQQQPSRSKKDYVNFLWSIAGGRPRVSDVFSAQGQQGPVLFFPHHLIINIDNKTCAIKSAQYGQGVPEFLVYEDNGQIIKKALPDASLTYSVVVGKRHGQYQAMLIDHELAESFLLRLYFFGDMGMKNIRRIYQDTNLTRRMQIDIFKIGTEAIF